MASPLSITQYFHGPTDLGIVWSDGLESYLDYVTLRQNCPCAKCEGEPDVRGRVVRPIQPEIKNLTATFDLRKIELVGGYALRFRWRDGHDTGLYPFDLLRRLAPTSPDPNSSEK